MKKAVLVALPVVAFVLSIFLLRLAHVGHDASLLVTSLSFPIAALVSYAVLGRRDITSALSGLVQAMLLALLSLLVIYLIRSGQLFAPDVSLYHLVPIGALALSTALLEEFIFRGILLGLLMKLGRRLPVVVLLAIQAAAFSASHFHKSPLFYVQAFVAGMFFGWTVLKSRSLWFAIGFHFGWDLMIVFATGYHSMNFGHVRGMVVFEPDYAQVENVIFSLAVGVAALLYSRASRPPRIASSPPPPGRDTTAHSPSARDAIGRR
jgi:membrane protease YdiL (CAAX protease family)